MTRARFSALMRHPLALPLIALIVLLLVNRAFNATFFFISKAKTAICLAV